MRVLITGATGLVGRHLSKSFLAKGFEITILGRSAVSDFRARFDLPCEYHRWAEPTEQPPPTEAFAQVDAVVHLAGESIAEGRWSEEKKRRIVDSRVKTTEFLARAIEKQERVKAVIGASAVGYYGSRGDEVLTEESAAGGGFLAETCVQWEKVWGDLGHRRRLVNLRTGIVLALQDGFLGALEPIFTLGLGGQVGSGRQWISWIHIDDLVRLIVTAVENQAYRGPMNAVAPSPVQNREFTKVYASALKMPAIFPLPEFAAKLALGEKAGLALDSQRVMPLKAKELGFEFKYKTLGEALGEIYSWKRNRFDRLFTSEQWVPKPVDEVFTFFSKETNLEELTPPFLNFKVLCKDREEIQEGCLIDYRLKIHRIPVHWQSRITRWNPYQGFQDEQVRGPYKKWEHFHGFESLKGGTLLSDRVVFQLPAGFLSLGLAEKMVRGDIEEIFSYRKRKIDVLFS